jgi:hypothetical protein
MEHAQSGGNRAKRSFRRSPELRPNNLSSSPGTAELVLLEASVKDAVGEHIPNLSRDNFKI